MEYEVKKVIEEIDLIALDSEEYAKINNFYKEIITKRFPRLADFGHIYDVQRLIMSDGLSRIEVLVSVDGKLPGKDAGFNRPIPDDVALTPIGNISPAEPPNSDISSR